VEPFFIKQKCLFLGKEKAGLAKVNLNLQRGGQGFNKNAWKLTDCGR
jgi:hypothetical protein